MSAYPFLRPRPSGSSAINVGKTERYLSIASGAIMTIMGIRRPNLKGLLGITTGVAMIYRGLSGHCMLNEAIGRDTATLEDDVEPIEVRVALTVRKSREEVYAFWRRLENLPRFMRHLSEVVQLNETRSSWTAPIPGHLGRIHWEAEITSEELNERLAWRSLPGADVDNAGEVVFRDGPGGQGTEIYCTIAYRPPQGFLGIKLGHIFNERFQQMIRDDIARFRQVIESEQEPLSAPGQ